MPRRRSIVSVEICGLSRNCVRASPPAKLSSANVTAETISIIMSPCKHFFSSKLIIRACCEKRGCSSLLSFDLQNKNSYTLNSLLLRISASQTCCRRILSCDCSDTLDCLFLFCFRLCFPVDNRPYQTIRQAPQDPNNEESAHGAGSWSIVYLHRRKHSTIFSRTTSRRF